MQIIIYLLIAMVVFVICIPYIYPSFIYIGISIFTAIFTIPVLFYIIIFIPTRSIYMLIKSIIKGDMNLYLNEAKEVNQALIKIFYQPFRYDEIKEIFENE